MTIKAELQLDGSDAQPMWNVLIGGHWAAGPYPARAFAVEWIFQNGFRQTGGEWVKEVETSEDLDEIPY